MEEEVIVQDEKPEAGDLQEEILKDRYAVSENVPVINIEEKDTENIAKEELEDSDERTFSENSDTETESEELCLSELRRTKQTRRVSERKNTSSHKCQVCEEFFKSKKELKNHIILHKYDHVTVCPFCNKAFTRSSNYEKHLSKHISIEEKVPVDVKKNSCDICREDFESNKDLEKHYDKHINNKRQFYCDFCLKIYKKKDDLRKHRLTHISKPQYLCASCGKEYFSVSKLNEHRDYCLNERRYPCPKCGKKFNVKSQLTRHVTIHETDRYIKCTLCEKTFSRHDNFRQHFRLHTGEKPYTCDVCGKAFRIKGSMLYHRNKHDSMYRQIVIKFENEKSNPKVEQMECLEPIQK